MTRTTLIPLLTIAVVLGIHAEALANPTMPMPKPRPRPTYPQPTYPQPTYPQPTYAPRPYVPPPRGSSGSRKKCRGTLGIGADWHFSRFDFGGAIGEGSASGFGPALSLGLACVGRRRFGLGMTMTVTSMLGDDEPSVSRPLDIEEISIFLVQADVHARYYFYKDRGTHDGLFVQLGHGFGQGHYSIETAAEENTKAHTYGLSAHGGVGMDAYPLAATLRYDLLYLPWGNAEGPLPISADPSATGMSLELMLAWAF